MMAAIMPSREARELLRGVAEEVLVRQDHPPAPEGLIRAADLEAAKTELIETLGEKFALIPTRVSADPDVQARIRDELDQVMIRMVARSAATGSFR